MVPGVNVSRFFRDESGGYPIWSLIWFSLYVAMGGLAVDVTDAYRNQTLLQSTADASALAAVMSLPDQNDAVAQALIYASDNMDPAINGNVLKADEVIFGNWDFATRTFTPGAAAPDAVRVITRRGDANANPLATNFLRILSIWGLSLDRWNISVEAVAVRYVPTCLRDGFVAQGEVDTRSDNNYYNRICIHGQDGGVAIGRGNYFQPGVSVSMGNLDDLFVSDASRNDGLAEALAEGDVSPMDVGSLGKIISGLTSFGSGYIPGYMYRTGGNGRIVLPEIVKGTSLPAMLKQYTIYNLNCGGQVALPANQAVSKVVIVANCRLHASPGVTLQDVVLATSYAGRIAAISTAATTVLGRADNCAEGGGVAVYTPGGVRIAAKGEWNGLRIVAGDDVRFTARNAGIHGISVEAGGDIVFASRNDFGLCKGGVPGRFAAHYRLVR